MARLYLAILILALAMPGLCSAQQTPEASAVQIFDTVMSPFCPGRTLSACPSEQARALRDDIVASLQKGKSVDEVKQELVQTYGDDVLGTPQGKRSRYFAWLVPGAFLLAGVLAIPMLVSRKRVAGPVKEEPAEAALDPYKSQIERELQERLAAKSGDAK